MSTAQAQSAAAAEREPDSSKTHLLVVEDEPVIRRLFSMLLTSAGYSVAEADDGFAALEEIRRRRPALILSDLNMPRMTGFELLSVIRRRFPSIHVIAMSGAFAGDQVPLGVAADAFYEKSGRPISTLVNVIQGLLEDARAASVPNAHAADAAGPAAESTPRPDPPIALWVSRRGTPIVEPYILLSCPECLRSFPHSLGAQGGEPAQPAMQVLTTPCVFCEVPVSYALLDSALTHNQGKGPSTA